MQLHRIIPKVKSSTCRHLFQSKGIALRLVEAGGSANIVGEIDTYFSFHHKSIYTDHNERGKWFRGRLPGYASKISPETTLGPIC